MDAPYSYRVLPSGEIITEGGRRRVCLSNKPLNPNAKEWSPQIHAAPVENRCLFITFSNGHPINEHIIHNFFTEKYGNVLERVYVHWPPVPKEGDSETETKKTTTPKFGKIVFRSSWIPLAMILRGKRQVKFIINGETLWCKKYDPEKTKASKKTYEKEKEKEKGNDGSSSSSS